MVASHLHLYLQSQLYRSQIELTHVIWGWPHQLGVGLQLDMRAMCVRCQCDASATGTFLYIPAG